MSRVASAYPSFGFSLLYSNFRNQMPHFCGRTHTTRSRSLAVPIAAEPPVRPAPVAAGPTHDEIAALAYSYWEKRGHRHGSSWEDWLRAERDLIERRKPLG